MEMHFVDSLSGNRLRPGDCVVELPINGERGDFFSVRPEGVVTLGHHLSAPVDYTGADAFQLTCAAWQAFLLAVQYPNWRPKHLWRPIRPVNLDDTLAVLLADPAMRPRLLALPHLPQLLHEIALTDIAGPLGYQALEHINDGCSLVNAIKRAHPSQRFADHRQAAIAQHAALAAAMMNESLKPMPSSMNKVCMRIIRSSSNSAFAECDQYGALAALYRQGYQRAIVVSSAEQYGRRHCTIGQNRAFGFSDQGKVKILPPLDWRTVNALEPGWGGRSTIGGGPRQGTKLSDEMIWRCFAI